MKKTDIALIVVVLLIIIVGILSFGKQELGYTLPLTLNGEAGLTEISYTEYKEKMESKEPFIFIVERTDCSYCITYMPIAKQFATDYNIPMYYINTDNLTAEEQSALSTSNSFFKKNINNWGTPTTMILVGTESIDEIPGATDADGLYDFVTKYVELENKK